MGLEPRRNGRLYFYRKQRHGDKVVSVYVGGGELAQLAAHMANLDRDRKRTTQRCEQIDRDRLDALHRLEIERECEVRRIVSATLTAAGYHNHKGEWRMQCDVRRSSYSEGSNEASEHVETE